jgi:hypothetical protein
MELQSFEQYVNQTILDRGYVYYLEGAISELNREDEDQWYALVEGSTTYEVEIRLNEKGQVDDYFCDCPFDGEVCKHIVAVLFKIRENIDITPSVQVDKNIRDTWEKLVKEVPAEELRQFVKEYGIQYSNFRNQFLLNFSDYSPEESEVQYKEIIEGVFNEYTEYGDFADYYDLYYISRKLHQILKEAATHIKKQRYKDAFQIASLIISECIQKIEYAYDNEGDLEGVIVEGFEVISAIWNANPEDDLKNSILDWLLNEWLRHEYNEYTFNGFPVHLILLFADSNNRIIKALHAIQKANELLPEKDTWETKFNKESNLNLMIDLYEKKGEHENASQIIKDNLQYASLRKKLIDEQLQKNNYSEAVVLIQEGIKHAENENLAGLVHDWKDELLKVQQEIGNNGKIQEIAKDLFVNHGWNLNYYKIYKNTFDAKEWEEEKKKIIEKLEKKDSASQIHHIFWFNNKTLPDVYIEESMWDALFQWVKKTSNIDTLNTYLPYLKDKYPSELLQIYRSALLYYSEQEMGRKAYRNMVDFIKKMYEIPGGKKAGQELAKEILNKYPRRPAMKDEFNALDLNQNS